MASRPQRPRARLRLAALATACLAVTAARAGATRRFALLVGDDDGGPGTMHLYYAHDDARRIRDILVRLGGVRPSDATLLLDATRARFLDALTRIDARITAARAAGDRTILVVYYSGHAVDGALRLEDTELKLSVLKARLADSPADVRIGILDSCRSGLIDRTKGARLAPAFQVDTGQTSAARGLVLLTSSSANEASQESDRIGGSYFTYNLASGLLGNADRSGDGRVTLSEAYAYAYDRTVAATAGTAAGPQHPTFAYDLAGNGDVVLTDVASGREGLRIPAWAPAGTYYLVHGDGRIAAEVDKPAGVARRIALAPGDYKVKRRLPDHLRIGDVEIPPGHIVTLVPSDLHDAPFSDDPVKGLGRFGPTLHDAWSLGVAWQGFFAAPDLFPSGPVASLTLSIPGIFGRGWRLGLDLDVGGTSASLTPPGLGTVSYQTLELGAGLSVVRAFDLGPVTLSAGGRLAWIDLSRRFDAATGLPGQYFATFTPGLVAGARLRLGAGFSVALSGRVHYLYYNVDGDRSLGYAELGAQIVYQKEPR